MELTPTPPETDDENGKDNGKDGLVWDPAGAKVDSRLGPYTPAVVDYLLHPPPGYPVPGSEHSNGLTQDRRAALEELIKRAFQP